jgi:hypothetical protein
MKKQNFQKVLLKGGLFKTHIGAHVNPPVPSDAITFEGETDLLTFEGETEIITFEI